MEHAEARKWAALSHVASLIAGVILPGLGYVAAPIVIWAMKKDEDKFVEQHAREASNFVLLIALVGVVFSLLCTGLVVLSIIPIVNLLTGIALIIMGICGFVMLLVIIILMISAAMKAYNGEEYQYPCCVFRPFDWVLANFFKDLAAKYVPAAAQAGANAAGGAEQPAAPGNDCGCGCGCNGEKKDE